MIQKFKSIIQYLKRHRRVQYLIICSIFGLSFTGVLFAGITHRYDTNQKITKLYHKTSIASNEMILVNRQYNSKTKLYRLDFYMQSDDGSNNNNRFVSDKVSVNNVSPEDPTKKLSTTLIRVTPQFYVMYVKNVPTEMMRTEINYKPAFNDDSDSKQEETVRIYSSNEDTKQNKSLIIDNNKNKLQTSLIDYQMLNIEKENKKLNKGIKNSKESIKDIDKELQDINKNLVFEIGEEKEASLERIDSMKQQKENEESKIQEKQEKLKENADQKALMEEQKSLLLDK